MAETLIPDDRSTWNAMEPIKEDIMIQGRTLLEAEQAEDDFGAYQLARDHYKACINEEKLEELGVKPMQQKLKEFGGWPVVEGNNWALESNFSAWEWTYKACGEGFEKNQLIKFEITEDDSNTSWRIISLDQADLGMSREYLMKGFDDKDVQFYYRFMLETAILFGAEPDRAKKEMKEALLFEIQLAKASTAKEDRRNVTLLYNPTTAGKVKNPLGLPLTWLEYTQNIVKPLSDVKIEADEKINIINPDYMEKLPNILTKTSNRTLANYLAWRITKPMMRLLNEEARKIMQRYRKEIFGFKVASPTWKRCTEMVGFNNMDTSNFIYVASSMFVKKYFKPEAKKEMLELTNYLRRSFEEEILQNINWMSEKVKDRAKKKLAEMDQFIAYSDEFLEKDKIDGLHQGIQISETDLFGNALNLLKFWRTFDFKNRLRNKVDRKSWLEHKFIALVNAFYSGYNNYIEFPAGILQGSFYSHNIPKYVNFGSIGVVIGHEITHGFDDRGKQRNEHGEFC